MSILDSFLLHDSGLWVFVVLGLVGITAGKLFSLIRLPEITGQVLVGLLVGGSVLGLMSRHQLDSVEPINQIALGVMTFIVGTHLNIQHLHNSGSRIVLLALFDVVFSFTVALLGLLFIARLPLTTALPLSALAIATAPATIIHLIQSKRARGVLVKTLIGVVALNNVAAIVVFELCKLIDIKHLCPETNMLLLHEFAMSVLYLIAGATIGAATGYFLALISRHVHQLRELFTYSLLAILLNVGICHVFDELSYLLINLAAGIAFTNQSHHTKRVTDVYEYVCQLLFAVFFTLAGTHLDLGSLRTAGLAGIAYVSARAVGKVSAIYLAGRAFNFTRSIRNYLGISLLPQAGLAIGLVISLADIEAFSGIIGGITAIVLSSVVISEILGPILTAKAFDLAAETNQATPRLLDFLHEEFIFTDLKAEDKWQAIDQMCRFMAKVNRLHSISPEELRESVLRREERMSTGIGDGLAIPHAIVPRREHLMGVIGILNRPIEFDALDSRRVDILILLATPEGQEDLHLKVLAAVAEIFSHDERFHRSIAEAKSAAEVYDLLQSKEIRERNYFLDDQ